jgi:membrane protease YdiL (CAAX protease family)
MDSMDGGRDSTQYEFGDWSRGPKPSSMSRAKTVLLAFGLVIAGFVTAVALFSFLGAVVDVEALSTLELTLLNLVMLQGVSFPLVAFLYLRWRGLPTSFIRARAPSLKDVLTGLGGFVGAFAIVFVALIVISSIGAPTAERADSEALQDPQILLMLIPLSILLIGPGEELLFRGVIQSTLREKFDASLAIVLASAAFAPAHVLALTGGPGALAVTVSVLFLPSLVFGAVYEYTENLVVPALSHGFYNATLFGIAYLVETSDIQAEFLLVFA